jgi:pyruvate-formate lyase-activating enzyme
MIYYGLKLIDENDCAFYTGQSSAKAIANLKMLDEDTSAAPYSLCMPLLAGIFDSEKNMRNLMELARSLKRLQYIEFLPANPFAAAKYTSCGRQIDTTCADCKTGVIPEWFDPGVPFHLSR